MSELAEWKGILVIKILLQTNMTSLSVDPHRHSEWRGCPTLFLLNVFTALKGTHVYIYILGKLVRQAQPGALKRI